MNTTDTTCFIDNTTCFVDKIAELAVSASNLLKEVKINYADKCISEEEYEGYVSLYNSFYDLICEFSIGEISANSFLRNLYDITKSYERLGNSVYINSMFDLLANAYVELVKINLCKKDV